MAFRTSCHRLRIPPLYLDPIIKKLFLGMAIVVNATRSLSVARQVLNVAYSLERKQAIKFPELGTFDTQWGTNREGKHTMNLVFVGGNAENVRAVQG